MPAERLSRWLAHQGLTSRRGAERLMREGRVLVNQQPAPAEGRMIDPEADVIEVDGRRVEPRGSSHRYLAVNKPIGVVSTVRDPEGRPTVMELAADAKGLYPVGRLDRDSRGLLLLTDDGELALRLTHPRYGAPKTYRVTLAGQLSAAQLQQLRRGPVLEDGPSRPLRVRVLHQVGERVELLITLSEGRRREVRRMVEAVGSRVVDLERTEFAGIRLGTLPEGAVRDLSGAEVSRLRSGVGLD